MSRSVRPNGSRAALPARSVALSLLLGVHPGRMAAADLVRAGRHFGIAEPTLRVALTRSVGAGDLVRSDDGYALGERLIDRQRRQDESVEHAAAPWDGTWEQVVVVAAGRAAADRAALRSALTRRHLAELREGVWMRPANLGSREPFADPAVTAFAVTPHRDARELADQLWDLDAWATRSKELLAELATTSDPAMRLSVAADVVRHLVDDPLLPAELLPDDWPGEQLRTTYADYQEELASAWV